MADILVFTLTTGKDVRRDVEDGEIALKALALGQEPFGEWIEVSGRQLIRRDAIVSVRIASEHRNESV